MDEGWLTGLLQQSAATPTTSQRVFLASQRVQNPPKTLFKIHPKTTPKHTQNPLKNPPKTLFKTHPICTTSAQLTYRTKLVNGSKVTNQIPPERPFLNRWRGRGVPEGQPQTVSHTCSQTAERSICRKTLIHVPHMTGSAGGEEHQGASQRSSIKAVQSLPLSQIPFPVSGEQEAFNKASFME